MPLLTAPTLSIAGKKKLEPFRYPELLKTDVVNLGVHGDNTLTYYKRGTVFSQLYTTVSAAVGLTFMPYDNAGSDGTEAAKCILQYDIVVYKGPTAGDQAYWYGNWTTSFPGPHGERVTTVPMIFGGCFLTSDLIVGAGTAEDTAVRLDSTNTFDMVDTLAALADLNATLGIQTTLKVGSAPVTAAPIYEFRF